MNIYVIQTSKKNIAQVFFKEKKFECFVGKNGIGKKTREGDFITPKGSFKMKKIYFREERINLVQSGIPLKKIKKTYSWCVDPKNKNYNNFLQKPLNCEYENLYRNDNLYDIIIVLDYNINPIKKYKGSAIFVHCSEKNRKFTEGCIAINKNIILKIIREITPCSRLIIF